MKKPSLEEVKEYFKDAKTVESNGIKKINHKDEYYECKGSIFMGNGLKRCALVWCKHFGYAKILTYKEPKEETFVISREQIHRLYDMADIQKMTLFKDEIRLLFPSAFVEDKKELVLEVGKWYNIQTKTTKYLLLYSDNKNELYAGFMDDKWSDYWLCSKDCNQKLAVLATPEEVKSALEKEAVKRGFVDGVRYNDVHTGSEGIVRNLQYCEDSSDVRADGCIFFKGKWAEIIPTITKAEAEQKLNCKII